MLIILDGANGMQMKQVTDTLKHRLDADVLHWKFTPPNENGPRFFQAMQICTEAVLKGCTVIWQNAWASEHVYSSRCSTESSVLHDPWLAEWQYGRAAATIGVRIILLGSNPEKQYAFQNYAKTFNWSSAALHRHPKALEGVVDRIMHKASRNLNTAKETGLVPPVWAGVHNANVVVVGPGKGIDEDSSDPWLPFSSRVMSDFARNYFGNRAFQVGWTKAYEANPAALRTRRVLIACGEVAYKWCRFNVQGPEILQLPHPSWLSRNTSAAKKRRIETFAVVSDVLKMEKQGSKE